MENNDYYIVLDIDRTIINGTSWFHACKTPDSLIKKVHIPAFLDMNYKTYVQETMSKEEFRRETINLINSSNHLNISQSLEEAGAQVLDTLNPYPEVLKYLNILHRYYGEKLKVIFLTSGYKIFMNGLITRLFEEFNIPSINYEVIGSELLVSHKSIQEKYHINQFEKQRILEGMIRKGIKISFLADDSLENINLFKLIEKNGGSTLKVEYKKHEKNNSTWKNYIDTFKNKELINYMKDIDSNTKILDIILDNKFLKYLDTRTDNIGILFMNQCEYHQALNILKNNLSKSTFLKLETSLNNLFLEKDDRIYLRNTHYYYWIVKHFDSRNSYHTFEKLLYLIRNILKVLENEFIEEKILLNNKIRIIFLSIFEHIQHIQLILLNALEKNNINNSQDNLNQIKCIDISVRNTTDLIFKCMEQKNIIESLKILISSFDYKLYLNIFEKNNGKEVKMRELENTLSIYKSVKHISLNTKENFDYIISFPYGGICLGYSYVSYIKVKDIQQPMPLLINCHYSSKKEKRGHKIDYENNDWFTNYISNFYNNAIDDLNKGNKKVLLFDNNSTTLETLFNSKLYLEKNSNIAFLAVVSFNYVNTYNYLCDYMPYEPMIKNWRYTLSYNPVEEYITAFDTWGTGEKSILLENLYSSKPNLYNSKNNKYIRKLCRVHNLFDLNNALKNGYNMIGIHAVITDKENYFKEEENYRPLKRYKKYKDIPTADYEVESISDMLNTVNEQVDIALVLENKLTINQINKCINVYNLNQENLILQFQHRVNKEYINMIRNVLESPLICTIGINQFDFEDYFNNLNNLLIPNKDYILIDMSKHQPDYIAKNTNGEMNESKNKMTTFNELLPVMQKSKIRIILADDISPVSMKKFIKKLTNFNVPVVGVDMQNNVEINKKEQVYSLFNKDGKEYHVKIRKSLSEMMNWIDFEI